MKKLIILMLAINCKSNDLNISQGVTSTKDLHECDDNHAGEVIYLKSENQLIACRDKQWKYIHSSDLTTDTFEIESTTICEKIDNSQNFAVKYIVQKTTNDMAFVTCQVISENGQDINAYFYANWQQGSVNGYCTVYSNVLNDKFSYFVFRTDENKVVYRSKNIERDGYTIKFENSNCQTLTQGVSNELD